MNRLRVRGMAPLPRPSAAAAFYRTSGGALA